MTRNSTLWRLQALEQEIDDKSKRARQVDDALANDPKVVEARAALEATQKILSEARAMLRDRELDASGLDAKIKDVEARLYGGKVTNPKELDGLEKDLQMHKRHRSDLDDKLLTLMDSVEQALRQTEEKALTLRRIEETRAGNVEHLAHEKEALARRLSELGVQREQTRAALDADALRQYDHLRRTKAGRAVSQIKHSSCGICGVAVPSGLINRVHAGEEIVLCSSCGRILAQ
jgi:predicted  nucleic acid-binding Zn-ribbon protein